MIVVEIIVIVTRTKASEFITGVKTGGEKFREEQNHKITRAMLFPQALVAIYCPWLFTKILSSLGTKNSFFLSTQYGVCLKIYKCNLHP
jgi:hypothetical protein